MMFSFRVGTLPDLSVLGLIMIGGTEQTLQRQTD
jgi:hypothetical protein